ncbi:hypothetical protein C7B67_24250 [filamentous cyanobacterium Phorm 6]|nr:hypothetical protein C7B67_24250 [filamentous cyanobacterium Phorm 6]
MSGFLGKHRCLVPNCRSLVLSASLIFFLVIGTGKGDMGRGIGRKGERGEKRREGGGEGKKRKGSKRGKVRQQAEKEWYENRIVDEYLALYQQIITACLKH